MPPPTNHPDDAERATRIRRVIEDCLRRRGGGDDLPDEHILAEHPDLLPELAEELRKLVEIRSNERPEGSAPSTAFLVGNGQPPAQFLADLARFPDEATAKPSLPEDAIPGYQLVREVSHGGQGVVYQAVQKTTKQKVAIKILLEGPYASPTARRRFEREIELVAQLKHANIVSVFHAGQTTDGRQFYVMEYVRGTPLTAYVREKKLGLEDALRLFAKVCEAVQYAHQRGIIHRDLKPSNILVDAGGEPKILDFGLAKWMAAPADSLVSISQHVMGTLPYMSPEQAKGKTDEVDTRTDIYALGVILYEMLTGGYPYPVVGQMAVVLRCIAEEQPTPPSRRWSPDSGIARRSSGRRSLVLPWRQRREASPIDDEVETIVLKALAKEQGRRYQSANELARDIGHYLAGEAIEARRDSALYVLRKTLRRYKGPVAATVAFVALLVGSSVLLYGMYQNQSRLRQQAEEAESKSIAAAEYALQQRQLADLKAESEAAAKHDAIAAKDEAQAERDRAEQQTTEAVAASEREKKERERAEKATQEMEYQSYLANIRGAAAALEACDVTGVRRFLDATPKSMRNWEWGYLNAQSEAGEMVLRGHDGIVVSVSFSPDGTRIVTASQDTTARVWDTATGQELVVLHGGKVVVRSAAFSPDGTRVVTASQDGVVRLWNVATGTLLLEFTGVPHRISSAMLSSDGLRIVSTSADKTAQIWHADTGDLAVELIGHEDIVHSARFSPDGVSVVTASADNTARVWDARTGEELAVLRHHTRELPRVTSTVGDHVPPELSKQASSITFADFSPDGLRIVTTSKDHIARLWDVATAESLIELRGHQGPVWAASFSPDGSRIVTASQDGDAKVWDATSGEELVTIRGDGYSVLSVAFSPDGSRFAAASRDGTVRLCNSAFETRRLVRLSGPSVGIAPHWIGYGVNLPGEILTKSDCLWMDNGEWISDEPRGVKILETPGFHRISVQVISHDNIEYCGVEIVRVVQGYQQTGTETHTNDVKPQPENEQAMYPLIRRQQLARVHVVREDETLDSITAKYYGDRKYWRKIFVANRNRLTDKDNLPVKMKLMIPP